jgi:hypothetical protein
MKEFEVEVNGQLEKIKMRDLTRAEARGWKEFFFSLKVKAKEIVAGGDELSEDALKMSNQIEDERAKILAKLCVEGPLKEAKMFEEASNQSLIEIYKWMDDSAGIQISMEKKDFTKS